MQSKAKTVGEYLDSLPEDRRQAIEQVRKVVNSSIDKDIQEGVSYGMIAWCVPHSVFPDGYHTDPKQPLPYIALASQKNYMALYMMNDYMDGGDGESWLREEWKKTGKKLDMGKSCIRFRNVDDLALDVIGKAIRRVPAKKHIETYLANRPAKKPKKKA
jgi:hypothetical protein